MVMTIDIGNSNLKVAFFEHEKMDGFYTLQAPWRDDLDLLISSKNPEKAIISDVRGLDKELMNFLNDKVNYLRLTNTLVLPFLIFYETPETLGSDRLANAAGAAKLFPDKNNLIVDCGTCITYTLINKGHLIGGSISPGIQMRLNALHHFTGKLPLVEFRSELTQIPGKNTVDSIRTGVINAIIAETDGLISQYCSLFTDLNVILTGGSMAFFEKHLKSPIFAVPYLTHEGLHEILKINNI